MTQRRAASKIRKDQEMASTSTRTAPAKQAPAKPAPVSSGTAPPSLPMPANGLTPDQERERLKEEFPDLRTGSTQEISEGTAFAYRYILWARGYWDKQLRLVTNIIRQELGDAETATVDGIPVAARRMKTISEYTVPAHDTDAIYPASRQG